MKLRRAIFLWLVVGFVTSGIGSLCAEETAPKKIKIGVISALSGPAQFYGIAMRNGIELAKEELQAKNIEVVYEDDRFITTNTVSAFKKLTEVDNVDLVISGASAPGKAVAPLAEQRKKLHLAWASDEAVSVGRKYVIRTYMSGREEGEMIAAESLKRGYQRVATIVSINDYPLSMEKGFLNSFPKNKLILSEQYPPEAGDYKTYLSKVKAKMADAIVICLNPGQLGTFAKQAKELGITAQICGCENLNNTDEVKASNNALVGAWFVTVGITDDFRKKYLAKYKNDNIISGAAVHYDLIYLVDRLLKEGESNEDLRSKILRSGKQRGALGDFEIISTEDDHFLKSRLAVMRITEDGFVEEK